MTVAPPTIHAATRSYERWLARQTDVVQADLPSGSHATFTFWTEKDAAYVFSALKTAAQGAR